MSAISINLTKMSDTSKSLTQMPAISTILTKMSDTSKSLTPMPEISTILTKMSDTSKILQLSLTLCPRLLTDLLMLVISFTYHSHHISYLSKMYKLHNIKLYTILNMKPTYISSEKLGFGTFLGELNN